jgi:hypothetical protein
MCPTIKGHGVRGEVSLTWCLRCEASIAYLHDCNLSLRNATQPVDRKNQGKNQGKNQTKNLRLTRKAGRLAEARRLLLLIPLPALLHAGWLRGPWQPRLPQPPPSTQLLPRPPWTGGRPREPCLGLRGGGRAMLSRQPIVF